MVTDDLLNESIETVATRALQKEMHSKDNNVEPESSFKKDDRVWVFFKTSKQNEKVRWIEERVLEALAHEVKCRRTKKGPPMTVAYEHLRVAPKGELANDLFDKSLEEELYMEEINQEAGSRGTDEVGGYGSVPETDAVRAENSMDNTNTAADIVETTVVDDSPPDHTSTIRETIMEDIFGSDADDITPLRRKNSLMSTV